jgi:hypothetical protein
MSESAKSALLALAIVVMAAGGFWIKGTLHSDKAALVVSARSVGKERGASKERGEFGGDLGFLHRFYVGPQSSSESNHYFDLWSPGALPALARFNGLTNNRALFVDSHGSGGFRWHGRGYGLYPRETLLRPGQEMPGFSPADFARVLGRDHAATIHNIVIAGCNEEGRFRSQEWRRHFVNATNITYMAPGRLAYKPMFYQAIVTPSSEIKPLFGRESRGSERSECGIEREPSPGAEPLGAYVADLYLPGARKAYRTQRAGRELLEAGCAAATTRREDTPWTPDRMSGYAPEHAALR